MEQPKNALPAEKLETAQIGVSGMTCDHCARRVEKALRANPGVKDAQVDRAKAHATVTFDASTTTLAQLHDSLVKSGYPPTGTPAA